MSTLDAERVAAAIRYTPPLRPLADQTERVLEVTAEMFDCTVAELTGRSRVAWLEDARRVAIAVVRATTTLSWREIGEAFDGRDHTTVIQSVQRTLNHPTLRAWAAAVDQEVTLRSGSNDRTCVRPMGRDGGTMGEQKEAEETLRHVPPAGPTPEATRSER